ncbi:hypothetical protein Plhal304r1_c016g0057561 [Plasmopara halstedii]
MKRKEGCKSPFPDIRRFAGPTRLPSAVRSHIYFLFLHTAHPGIIYCVRSGCNAVETERHLFFDCVLAAGPWPVLFCDWSAFFVTKPKWLDIFLGRRPSIKHITRCITLHLLWTVCNDGLFRQSTPLPMVSALQVVYTTFSAHIRACMCKVFDRAQPPSLLVVLSQLRRSHSLGAFMRANTALFDARLIQKS